MPLYEIHHSAILTSSQRQSLASGLTNLHCKTFSAPSSFVNIAFHGPSDVDMEVGWEKVQTNYIIGHLRPRPIKPASTIPDLVTSITNIWNSIVRDPPGRLDDPRALHNCFILEDIDGGAEQGFILPVAGNDGNWLEGNMKEFERRAGLGDVAMEALVREIENGIGSGPAEVKGKIQ
ncbi:hypothetical protein P154DRAFT_449609 [Amniculicola lignicola CBS 123094]|uniref:Tautomerase cis-CaaD-like domain-containing protein n=1 Tax=Amniculicola lignicola CBS 123094 TaxID=1392246 RepID=A0A6A5W7P8_9PLEO|nr:hypothetical protein P154DRAFT_449609 [Amniculicola lignicola CBS 123094]